MEDATRTRVPVGRILHTIHAARDADALRRTYLDAFGGLAFAESYHEGEDRDMTLLYVADHMVEPMAPRRPDAADTMLSRYLAKYGEGWHSTSIQVADAALAAQIVRDSGATLTTNYPGFFFVHPDATGGIVFEVTDYAMTNDPKDEPSWNPDWAAARAHQPKRLDAVVCCVRDAEKSVAFFTGVLDGTVTERGTIDWPQSAAFTRLSVGDGDLLLLEPDANADGPLSAFLAAPNSGVYALSWRVSDVERASAGMRDCGLSVTPMPSGAEIALAGARHWFLPR